MLDVVVVVVVVLVVVVDVGGVGVGVGMGDGWFLVELEVEEGAEAKLDEAEVKLEELLFVWDNGPSR